MALKVRTPNGVVCWLQSEALEEDTNAALAPIEHCDEEGELDLASAIADGFASYAHLSYGEVMRYGRCICHWDDLEVIDGDE